MYARRYAHFHLLPEKFVLATPPRIVVSCHINAAGDAPYAGLPWVWGFPWGFPWVWVWYGYGDCDESPWVLWVICGDF